MPDEFTFLARWISPKRFYIEIWKNGEIIATSKHPYGNPIAAGVAARKALEALRQGDEKTFNETFSKAANAQNE